MPINKFTPGSCNCDCSPCTGCVRVIEPCSGLPKPGAVVELLKPVTREPVGSWTTDGSGVACGLPVGSWLMLISYPPIVGKREQTLIPVTCNGTTDVNGPTSGVVRCLASSCRSSVGGVATTYTFTRSGQPTITATTSGRYIDVWLPVIGNWNYTATAGRFLNRTGIANVQSCSTITVPATFFNDVVGTTAAGYTCSCARVSNNPNPVNQFATATDCKGTASIDLGTMGFECGGNYCADRTFDRVVSSDPPQGWCRTVSGGNSLANKAYDSVSTGTAKLSASASFRAFSGPSPQGTIATTRTMNRYANGLGTTPGVPTNPLCDTLVYQKEAYNRASLCSDSRGTTGWSATSYTIHSVDPPVIEFFFDYPSDVWGPVSDSDPNPKGPPPCGSIIMAVNP